MNWHDDMCKAFGPLSKHVEKEGAAFDETMEQYMYMGHEEDLYYYKHIDDRSYLKLDPDGDSVAGSLNNWEDWI